MRKSTFIYGLVLSTIFILACKKKKDTPQDTVYPVITINKPVPASTFNMFDTIRVNVHVSDDNTLEEVTVSLTDLNHIPVQSTVSYTPNAASWDIDIGYELYEYHLPSGYYYIAIHASDGINNINSARKIYINASPIIKQGYYIFTGTGIQHQVLKLDTNFSQNNSITRNGPYNGSALSNYYQRLYVNGSSGNQEFDAYNCITNQLSWDIPNSGAGAPYFTWCDTDGKNAFLGYYDGRLIRYDYTSTATTNYNYTNSDYSPLYGSVVAGKYIVHYRSRVLPGSRKLVVFDLNSGTALKETNVNFNTLGIFEKSPTEAYVLGNDDNNIGRVFVLTIASGSMYEPINLNSAKILSCCITNSNTLLISMSDNEIYGYDYAGNNLISVLSGFQASRIRYSTSESRVYISGGKQLKACQLNNLTLSPLKTYNLNDTIRDFQLLYNK